MYPRKPRSSSLCSSIIIKRVYRRGAATPDYVTAGFRGGGAGAGPGGLEGAPSPVLSFSARITHPPKLYARYTGDIVRACVSMH